MGYRWVDHTAELELRVQRLELDDGGLRAHRGDPRHVVKGVTYHRLTFEPTDGGYRATVVLDV